VSESIIHGHQPYFGALNIAPGEHTMAPAMAAKILSFVTSTNFKCGPDYLCLFLSSLMAPTLSKTLYNISSRGHHGLL
jgi:hypothetical protein